MPRKIASRSTRRKRVASGVSAAKGLFAGTRSAAIARSVSKRPVGSTTLTKKAKKLSSRPRKETLRDRLGQEGILGGVRRRKKK